MRLRPLALAVMFVSALALTMNAVPWWSSIVLGVLLGLVGFEEGGATRG